MKKKPPPLRKKPPPIRTPKVDTDLRNAGLIGDAYAVIEAIQANPRAMQAVHELQFAAATIRRRGSDLSDLVRPWLVNAVRYAREILER